LNSLHDITIVSGGQTGADRAALDFAIERGLAHGGWCPRDRLAEDGPIDSRYDMQETPSRRYAERTEWNVRDSDATIVFTMAATVSGGTALTVDLAARLGKPCLHLSRDAGDTTTEYARRLLDFLAANEVKRLNIAGPRASQEPEIAAFVQDVLEAALAIG
jgi:predicted Rossmann fold nucleotide-binding protein DprA/Smf involved in DNA uptake